jgi:hypothetical protein
MVKIKKRAFIFFSFKEKKKKKRLFDPVKKKFFFFFFYNKYYLDILFRLKYAQKVDFQLNIIKCVVTQNFWLLKTSNKEKKNFFFFDH